MMNVLFVGWVVVTLFVGQLFASGISYAETIRLYLKEDSGVDKCSFVWSEGCWGLIDNHRVLVSGSTAKNHIENMLGVELFSIVNSREKVLLDEVLGEKNVTPFVFADTHTVQEFSAVLDKILWSDVRKEAGELSGRWRTDMFEYESLVQHYRTTIKRFLASLVLIVIVAGGWIIYLRLMILKRIEVEKALNDKLAFKQALIDGIPHPVFICDCEGRILTFNDSYLKVMGHGQDLAFGTCAGKGLGAEQTEIQSYYDDFQRVIKSGVALELDRLLKLDNGTCLTIHHWMTPYRTAAGEVAGMISGWLDISERQELLDKLIEAKNAADNASKSKTTFLATMSHEIRTPMNAVIGMLELASKRADQGVVDRFSLDVAASAAHGLLELIGDVLDIAQIESGCLSLNPQRTDLRELTRLVASLYEGLAQQKNLRLRVELDSDFSPEVMIDPLRLKQILSNLLSNAIKFTESGHVTLSLSIKAPNADNYLSVKFRVADTGIGISEADLSRLFNPYIKASNNKLSTSSGSGLGLVICRTLCEMMGGQLLLRSNLELGTVAEVCFELAASPASYVTRSNLAPQHAHSSTLNILIIDDYLPNRIVLKQQLIYLGHYVVDVENGVRGLQAWQSTNFDVVITDCSMPGMDGYELARAIRSYEMDKNIEACWIIGFTASAQPEEHERCLSAGMNDCLFKPATLSSLGQCLTGIQPRLNSMGSYSTALNTIDIDLTNLKQLAKGDRGVVKHLLSELIVSLKDDMQMLMRLYSNDDLPGLTELAHRVKGGASIIKASDLVMVCSRLELACTTEGGDLITEAVDAMQQSMELLVVSLESLQ